LQKLVILLFAMKLTSNLLL